VSELIMGSATGSGAAAAQVASPAIRLSDGRELFYFDDREPYLSGAAKRTETDARGLTPPDTHSEIRLDVLTGDYVAMAAHRMNRTYLPPANENPLAPTRPGEPPTEIPAPDYDVVVFENRFPSFSGGIGRCEVVCFTSDPTGSFATLSERRARTVIEAWADRTEVLSALPSTRQVVPFENRGEEIGVTLAHPHGQIYAYPYCRRAPRRWSARHGRIARPPGLAAGRRAGRRAAGRGADGAARRAVERVRAARRQVAARGAPGPAPRRTDLAALTGAERAELAVVYLDLLQRVDRFFPGVARTPYIAAWHQAPVGRTASWAGCTCSCSP